MIWFVAENYPGKTGLPNLLMITLQRCFPTCVCVDLAQMQLRPPAASHCLFLLWEQLQPTPNNATHRHHWKQLKFAPVRANYDWWMRLIQDKPHTINTQKHNSSKTKNFQHPEMKMTNPLIFLRGQPGKMFKNAIQLEENELRREGYREYKIRKRNRD